MSYTRQQWFEALLVAIGNKTPTLKTLQWGVEWTKQETGSPPGAQYNLLNTTELNTPGVVSDFNSVGVKNYDTFGHGIQANAKVLQNGLYPALLAALRSNSSSLFTVNVAINANLSVWGTGKKMAQIIAGLGNNMNEEFPGNDTVSSVPSAWIKYIPDLRYDTGISNDWLKAWATYGSPLTPEMEVNGTLLVVQEFEYATGFWINGVSHWRVYT